MSEFAHMERDRETSPMEQAWSEAYDRVAELPGGEEVIKLTRDNSDIASIQQYLDSNRQHISPEAIFFLETTIALRNERGEKGGH
jgi:hypothetical protein